METGSGPSIRYSTCTCARVRLCPLRVCALRVCAEVPKEGNRHSNFKREFSKGSEEKGGTSKAGVLLKPYGEREGTEAGGHAGGVGSGQDFDRERGKF